MNTESQKKHVSFEHLFNVCLIDLIIKFLDTDKLFKNIYQLQKCNKKLCQLISDKMIKLDYFLIDNINNSYKFDNLKHLIIDLTLNKKSGSDLINSNILDKYSKISNLIIYDDSLRKKNKQKLVYNKFPNGIVDLKLSCEFNQELYENLFPPSLLFLSFGRKGAISEFNQKIQPFVLPKKLKSLIFYEKSLYNQPFDHNALPKNLEVLKLGNNYDQHLEIGILPDTLTILHFGDNFNHPLSNNILPSYLKKLKFGHKFNQPLAQNILSLNLKILKFGDSFNQSIPNIMLLDKLEFLKFGFSFNQPIFNILPRNLKTLCIGDKFRQYPFDNTFFENTFFVNTTYTVVLNDIKCYNLKDKILDHSLTDIYFKHLYNYHLNVKTSEIIQTNKYKSWWGCKFDESFYKSDYLKYYHLTCLN